MKTKTKAMVLAGVFAITASLPVTALARRGGAAGAGGICEQTQRNDSRMSQRQRRNGTCVNRAEAIFQKQNQTDQNKKGERPRRRDGSCIVPAE